MTSLPRKIPKLTTSPRVPLPTSTKKANLSLGSRVSISGQREGILRYYGNTEFAEGLWCGVELFDASGKNDGEVSGVRYFQCAENHGVFAASHKVTAVSDVQTAGHLSTASANSDVNGNRVENLDHSGVLDESLVFLNSSTFTESDQSACQSVERLRRTSSTDEPPAPGCNRTFDLPNTARRPAMSDDSILCLSGLDTSFGVVGMASLPAPETASGQRRRSPQGQAVRFSTPSADRLRRNSIAMSTPQGGAVFELEDGFLPFDEEEMARETARILEALQEVQGAEGDAQSSGSILMLSSITDDLEHLQCDVSGQQVLDANASCEACAGNPALNATQTLDCPANTTQTLDCAANTTQTLDCAANTTQTLDCAANTTQTLDCAANTTQTLDCAANTTQPLDCAANTTQPLDNAANTTQTLDCASTRPPDNGLNITSTLPDPVNEMNTTQVLNMTQEVDPQLNSTVAMEGHANTTQTLTQLSQPHLGSTLVLPSGDLRAEEGETVSVMRMSVDESSTSKGGNSSMALSTDSAALAEELPADRASTNAESASNQRAVCTESGQSEASSQGNSAQNHMQVDEVVNSKKLAAKKDKDGRPHTQVKNKMLDKRRILPAPTSKPAIKQRESLLPSAASKTKEKEKSPSRLDARPKVIQKSKPKSKWADISKQIEQSARAPKSPGKPIQSKLSAADSEPAPTCPPAATLRKPVERATSISSDISQNSQTSIGSSKKPLKRHTLVPPATSSQRQEFKKPRASLLPPPPSRSSGPKPKLQGEGKLKAPKAITGLATNSASQHSDGPPPDVVASNSPASKAKPTSPNKTAGKASHDKQTTKSEVVRLQSELAEALRAIDCKSRYADGLKSELVKANKSLEGLGVVVQHLTRVAEAKEQELATSREKSMQLSQSHQQQLMACQNETELLSKNHEDEKRAVVAHLMEEREREMSRLSLDNERMREELSRACAEDIERSTREHEEEKTTLMKEIDHLKGECTSWKVRFDEALHNNKDHKLQEIESLKAVVELKNAEVKELRCENNVYQQKVETIPDLEKKLYDTEQRLENAQALLDIVSSKEKETADKYHKITRKAVQEKKENHRLCLNVEALELKLEEVEFTNSMHLAPDTSASDLDISTASLPAYGLENPDMSPSLFTRSFSRSSAKRRSQRSSNNTEIPEHPAC